MLQRRFWTWMLTTALCAGSAHAADRARLHDLLPQDTLAFAEIDTPAAAETQPANRPGIVNLGLDALQSLGILQGNAGLVADTMGLAGELAEHRCCFALLDANLAAKPDNALDCRSVQLVWILETDQPQQMIERLTRMLSHYSTRATVHQSVRQAGEAKKEFVEFSDSRWPAWIKIAWAQEAGGTTPDGRTYGSRFILTLGEGAMEHYLADRPVAESPWSAPITQIDTAAVLQNTSPGGVMARVYVSAKSFRDRFPQAMTRTILGRLFTSLEIATADASIFTARSKGRELSLGTATFEHGQMTQTPWTVPLPANSPLLKAVPDEATAYLVLKIDWPALYARMLALSDAILTDPTDQPVEKIITDLAKRNGIDIQKDILDHLQPLVLIHDFPQHPLHLPLMVTALSAAEAGTDEKVRAALTKLTAAIASRLDAKAAPKVAVETGGTPPADEPAGDFTRLRLRTDPDGTTYLQFGLVGPAWSWVQNRLVVSWSPGAVRLNKPAASRVTSSAFAAPR
jgi:hypothetical protein